ncbi:ABC transporter substrate-binding protein [Macrococcus sp. DPC7161]|uniref:ABC transporter substrate-binding protein n=1 Tax=Macrococcus sp. DPC7161 TaxID=2507060 RepID=UPI0013E8F5E7|nr:ABC transporter substrate-binding protein [Macrococcus sp. DPC7161]
MDKFLLHLYQLRHKSLSQKEISERLQISQKQLARKLKIWQSNGVITYQSGKGRGNKTEITFKEDIEKDYFKQFIKQFNHDKTETLIPYLTWQWSPIIKQKVVSKLNEKLGIQSNKQQTKLTITKRHRLYTIKPLEALDAKSASVAGSIYNRLIKIDEHGTIHYELAHHIEQFEGYIIVYLRPNVYFHDGSILTSDDVVHSFNQAKAHYNTRDLFEQITDLYAITPLQVKICYQNCPHIIYLLSYVTLSIFKETENKMIGTGPYFIRQDNANATILKRFDQYFGYSPFIDEIEMIHMPDDYQMIIGNPESPLSKIKRTLGFYYLCKHPDSKLSLEQIHYLQAIFLKHLDAFGESHHRASILYNSNYPNRNLDNLTVPKFNLPIRIDAAGKFNTSLETIETLLNCYNIQVEFNSIPFEHVMQRNAHLSGDFYYFGEFLDIPETLSYYLFIFSQISSIHPLISRYKKLMAYKTQYLNTAFENWPTLNQQIDHMLYDQGILFPLFNKEVELTYDAHLQNVIINPMGFINFHELWLKK